MNLLESEFDAMRFCRNKSASEKALLLGPVAQLDRAGDF